MLAELAAANAAYKIIRSTIANGSELIKAGSSINKWVNAKEDLTKKANNDKKSFWHRGKDPNDLESFMALEAINNQQKEIEQAMIYYGRPGLHGEWIKFQAEARKQRIKDAAERVKKRQQIIEIAAIATGIIIVGVGLTLLIYFAYWLKHHGA